MTSTPCTRLTHSWCWAGFLLTVDVLFFNQWFLLFWNKQEYLRTKYSQTSPKMPRFNDPTAVYGRWLLTRGLVQLQCMLWACELVLVVWIGDCSWQVITILQVANSNRFFFYKKGRKSIKLKCVIRQIQKNNYSVKYHYNIHNCL